MSKNSTLSKKVFADNTLEQLQTSDGELPEPDPAVKSYKVHTKYKPKRKITTYGKNFLANLLSIIVLMVIGSASFIYNILLLFLVMLLLLTFSISTLLIMIVDVDDEEVIENKSMIALFPYYLFPLAYAKMVGFSASFKSFIDKIYR